MTGNELNVDDEYLMKMKDGKYFYVGKLKDRRKRYNPTLEQYSVNYDIFIFENMPPMENVQKMFLWHYYPLFKRVPSDKLDEYEIIKE
jgi:hypothetical protein